MMKEYKLFYSVMGEQKISFIQRARDNLIIPFSEDNVDYQEYLQWLSEGNTPDPADETIP